MGLRVPVAVTVTLLPCTWTEPDQPASRRIFLARAMAAPALTLSVPERRDASELVGASASRLLSGSTRIDLSVDQLAATTDEADQCHKGGGGDDQQPHRGHTTLIVDPTWPNPETIADLSRGEHACGSHQSR